MSDNDLKVDIDFDSILIDEGNQKLNRIKKKMNSKKEFSTEEKQNQSEYKKNNAGSANTILISMNFDQIHLNLEYYYKDNEKIPTIIEILSDLKEKL